MNQFIKLFISSKQLSFYAKNGIRKMGVWQRLESGPPNIHLELYKMYIRDQNKQKIDLTVRQYRDDNDKPYVFPSVRKAEMEIFKKKMDREYLPISGMPELCTKAVGLVLGDSHNALTSKLIAMSQTLSGTGALRVAAEFMVRWYRGCKCVYIPRPSWDNHLLIFKHAGLDVKKYDYYKRGQKTIDYSNFISSLKEIPSTAIVLFHANAHNPTGFDPSPEQWKEISNICKTMRLFPVFDLACLGFASGSISEDALPIQQFIADGQEVAVAQSFAQNMGLYGNRVGVLWFLTESKDVAKKVLSHLKIAVRSLYSNPPLHGARIALSVLQDSNLKKEWMQELLSVSDRIYCTRKKLVDILKKKGSSCDWNYLIEQNGMRGVLVLNEKQTLSLRKDHHIYLRHDGYVSFAGVNSKNVEFLANALHAVTK